MRYNGQEIREAGHQLAEAARVQSEGDTIGALLWLRFRWRSAPDAYEREVQAVASRALLAALQDEQ